MKLSLVFLISLSLATAGVGGGGKQTSRNLEGSADYKAHALAQMTAEASRAALALRLPEALPLSATNLSGSYICPLWFAGAREGGLGNIETRDFAYGFQSNYKLGTIQRRNEFEALGLLMHEYNWPISRLDTNGAINIAHEFLALFRADLPSLDRDCRISVIATRPDIGRRDEHFTPFYYIQWVEKTNIDHPDAGIAGVRFFLPSKTLFMIYISDPKYNLRDAVTFTELDEWIKKNSKPQGSVLGK